MKSFNKAFTLAEVLITLGIIGIVAAMTMPALMQHYKKQEASARLKKFYSLLNQAIRMSVADNGEISTWTHNTLMKDNDGKYDEAANQAETKRFYDTYLKKYIKSVSEDFAVIEGDQGSGKQVYKVVLADGSCFYVRNGSCVDFVYDYNGDKLPNKNGQDRFVFLISIKNSKSAGPNAFNVNYSRTQLLNQCKNNSYVCSALIFRDNWEFKSDYPYKL